MKRRSFLQSVLVFLGLLFVPETKAKTIITDSKPIVGEFGTFGHIRWISTEGRFRLTEYESYDLAVDEVELALKEYNQKVYAFIKAKFLKC